MSNTVIQFPENKIVRQPTIPLSVKNKMQKRATKSFADDISRIATNEIFTFFERAGFNFDNPILIRDLEVVTEFLRSVIYRQTGLNHVLQKNIDNVDIKKVQDKY